MNNSKTRNIIVGVLLLSACTLSNATTIDQAIKTTGVIAQNIWATNTNEFDIALPNQEMRLLIKKISTTSGVAVCFENDGYSWYAPAFKITLNVTTRNPNNAILHMIYYAHEATPISCSDNSLSVSPQQQERNAMNHLFAIQAQKERDNAAMADKDKAARDAYNNAIPAHTSIPDNRDDEMQTSIAGVADRLGVFYDNDRSFKRYAHDKPDSIWRTGRFDYIAVAEDDAAAQHMVKSVTQHINNGWCLSGSSDHQVVNWFFQSTNSRGFVDVLLTLEFQKRLPNGAVLMKFRENVPLTGFFHKPPCDPNHPDLSLGDHYNVR